MTVYLAVKTQAAIEQALRADQGARFRRELGIAIQDCDDAFRGEEEFPFRSHLGASILGRDCARELWYNFHWAKTSKHIGRTLRLFNRGHLEEPRFVAMLRMIGCEVWQTDDKNKQFRISYFGGHYGSAIDGVIKGCPDLPDRPIMGEFKTYNDKNFQKLKKLGMREAKPEHYVQVNQYCKYYKLSACLYMAVNKNDDELYCELIRFDEENAEQYLDRAEKIVFATEPPAKINPSSAFFTCKFCDFRETCHKGHGTERNCRTCRYSRAMQDGTWSCIHPSLNNPTLTKDMQFKGCTLWDQIPGMVSKDDPTQLPDFSGAFSFGVLRQTADEGEPAGSSPDGNG